MAKHNNAQSGPSQINLIAAGTTLEGSLTTKDDIRVSGTIKGALHVEGKAIIAQEGSVDGDLFASDADIAGSLVGEVNVKGKLVLKGTAKIQGTIRTTRLIVEEGARIDGNCEMGQLDKNRAEALKSGNSGSAHKQSLTPGSQTSAPSPPKATPPASLAASPAAKPSSTYSIMSGD